MVQGVLTQCPFLRHNQQRILLSQTSCILWPEQLCMLVIFSKFSRSTAGSHFQRTCSEKLNLLHFSKNWLLSVRCPLTIQACTSGRNLGKFDQRGGYHFLLLYYTHLDSSYQPLCHNKGACPTLLKPPLLGQQVQQ